MDVPEDLLGSSVLEQPTGVSGGETSRETSNPLSSLAAQKSELFS